MGRRKIKLYNQKKIKVRTDGKMKPMFFKTAMQAINKSHKAYFGEDGHVELESFEYSHRKGNDSEGPGVDDNQGLQGEDRSDVAPN